MYPKDGFQMVNELREQEIETTVVFVTGHDHFAINAIKTAAFDYLLKPVCLDELKKP
ncbi:MAG: response regulator [Candidatus Moranbacteria bacterium]|nr:response regulator [Candidatus Moranbacteria bacterium]